MLILSGWNRKVLAGICKPVFDTNVYCKVKGELLMLLACDIDGTIATNGNYFCRVMADQAEIVLPPETLAHMTYGLEFWDLPQVRALTHEQRTALHAHAYAHHKDLDRLEQSVPIPGAREALQAWISEGGRVIYVTCRPPTAEQLTRDWLTRYGFPCATQIRICERYHTKYMHAHAIALQKEPVVLIDDQIEKMVPAFRVLVKEHRPIALSLILRLAVVQIGEEHPPTFPFPVPFPVLACPTWRPEDMERAFQHLIAKNVS